MLAQCMCFVSVMLTGVMSVGGAAAQSQQPEAADRLANMEKLLHQSSGAKQVLGSGNAAARAKRQEALEAYAAARQQMKQGNNESAAALLDRSTRLMFEAIRISTPSSLAEDKKIDNYGRRRESVMALRDAFNRISDENRETETRARVNAQLDTLIASADGLLQKGDNNAARIEIDKAYHLLKVNLEAVRSGQTLIRSLQFASKEEEYLYEIDRNDTHRMLVGLLVDEKQSSNATRQKIVEQVEQARGLRQQAESFAGQGEHQQAIDLLEQSTQKLVRAIRSAGIYIPG